MRNSEMSQNDEIENLVKKKKKRKKKKLKKRNDQSSKAVEK